MSTPFSKPKAFQSHESGSLIETAPSGVSAWSGPTVNITKGSEDKLRVSLRVPLCSIGIASAATSVTYGNSLPAMFMAQRTSFGGSGTVQPTETIAMSPTLLPCVITVPASYTTRVGNADCSLPSILSAAFSKYRIASDLKLHYMPQTTTVDPAAFALTVTDDPMHPQAAFGAYTAATGSFAPSFATVKNSTNSIVFASWSTWSKTFPLDKSTVYYTTTPLAIGIAAGIPFGVIPPWDDSNLRFSHFGAITAYANMKAEAGGEQMKGELYYEVEYEFFDFVPVTGAATTPFSMMDWYALVGRKARDDAIRSSKPDSKEQCTDPDDEQSGDDIDLYAGPPLPSAAATKLSSTYYVVKPLKHSPRVKLGPTKLAVATTTAVMKHSPLKNLIPHTRSSSQRKISSDQHIIHAIKHLNKFKNLIPKSHHPVLAKANSAASSKKSGWKDIAKQAVKKLVNEVPVVGGLLGGLTDVLGDPILDFLGSLF